MPQILAVVIGFLLTAFVGNRILQSLQHRSWLRQQQFLGSEKEFLALRDLAGELSKEIGARLYQMRRLNAALLRSVLEDLEERLKIYDVALTSWNENLGSHYVRLTFYASHRYTHRLEVEVHDRFAAVGGKLESMVRERRAGKAGSSAKHAEIEAALNSLQGAAQRFSRDLQREVEERRRAVYFGTDVPYKKETLEQLSTGDLFKLLFIRRVNSHSVFRPSTHL